MNKPSKGIKILAWLDIIASMFILAKAVFGSSLYAASYRASAQSQFNPDILLAAASLWIAWHVLKLKELARKWIIFLTFIGIGRMILWLPYGLSLYKNDWGIWILFCSSLIVHVIYIYFFTRSTVKKQFIN